MMPLRGANRKLLLLFIDIGILLCMALGFRDSRIDKYSLLALGGVALLVLNVMFFVLHFTEPDLPKARLGHLNKYVVWPIILLAALVAAIELFSGK